MRLFGLFALVMVLSGCAISEAMHEAQVEKLNAQVVGEPITYVTDRLGYPTNTIDLPDGATVYGWQYRFDDYTLNVMGGGGFVPSQGSCQFWVRPDDAGLVQELGSRGDCGGSLKPLFQ